MKEFIEKLIGRLEEELKTAREMQTTQCIGHDGYGTPLQSKLGGEICALLKVQNIVSQLAEEYKEECEYKENFVSSGSVYFLTGCSTRHNGFLNKNRPYCGFCGKKIRVAPYQPKGE